MEDDVVSQDVGERESKEGQVGLFQMWPNDMVEQLQLLVDEVKNDDKQSNESFIKRAIGQNVIQVLAKFGKNVTDDEIKNKIKNWRRQNSSC